MRAKDRNRGTGGEPNSGCFFGSEPGYHHGVDDNYHDDDLTVAFALTYPRQISFWAKSSPDLVRGKTFAVRRISLCCRMAIAITPL